MAGPVDIADQGSFIPASQRPDGSWRKARRVKEGYVPQEEVPLYESKGKQWANSRTCQYPVGINPSIMKAKEEAKQAAARSPIPGLVIEGEGKKKKKKKKIGENEINGQVMDTKTNILKVESNRSETDNEWQTVQSKSAKAAKVETVKTNVIPSVIDPAKRLKNLKKKLREIETIEGKIASGEIKKPDKDQIEKVNRKTDILSEMLSLELTVDQ